MTLKILLAVLCGVGVVDAGSSPPQPPPPPLLLVSFDGFRADYLQRFPMPNLKLLYSQGVLVEELTNVFITKTFPNHYTLVTGLYPESHGILANVMYDPVSHKDFHVGINETDPEWWSEAQPLWLTALDSGYETAAMMWPGSSVAIGNRTASRFVPFNPNVTFQERVRNVTNWMLGDGKEQGVTFAALYWEEPDQSGHKFGPDNVTAMSQVLKEVDDNIGLLVSELKRTGLWGRINVLVVSDHGMAQCSADCVIKLDDCIHPDTYRLVDVTPVASVIPLIDPEVLFAKLKKCHTHMTPYLKSAIPDRLHYSNNKRIQPIILVADEGCNIVRHGNEQVNLGNHGYDNSLPSMHPFMAASGPSFRQGYRLSSLQSVDIYPLMCHLLSVPPRPNNGSLTQARCLLAAEICRPPPLLMVMVVGVLLTLTAITVVLICLRRRRSSHTWLFQRLQVDDDDENLLE